MDAEAKKNLLVSNRFLEATRKNIILSIISITRFFLSATVKKHKVWTFILWIFHGERSLL